MTLITFTRPTGGLPRTSQPEQAHFAAAAAGGQPTTQPDQESTLARTCHPLPYATHQREPKTRPSTDQSIPRGTSHQPTQTSRTHGVFSPQPDTRAPQLPPPSPGHHENPLGTHRIREHPVDHPKKASYISQRSPPITRNGHTTSIAPHPVRSVKLSGVGPG